jgi:tRNA(Ile)-lysidine synthase
MQRQVKTRTGASAFSQKILETFAADSSVRHLLEDPPASIAVALSGGPDSMALLFLLSQLKIKTEIHAITIDHDLRKESAAEAKQVAKWMKDWPHVHHHILKWSGTKPATGIMERAREARYTLLGKWCKRHKITQLWLGHNQTDQTETFLFRLAKGSGLDGLSGMQAMQPYKGTGLMLIRPLLNIAKNDLQKFCIDQDIPHVQDPTNINLKYARSRLRQSLPILEAEGLSEKRLCVTAQRLARAREALDFYAKEMIENHAVIKPDQAVIPMDVLCAVPEEIRLRIVRILLAQMGNDRYGPRLETLEDRLVGFFANPGKAKRFTLGGFLFAHKRKTSVFTIIRETA